MRFGKKMSIRAVLAILFLFIATLSGCSSSQTTKEDGIDEPAMAEETKDEAVSTEESEDQVPDKEPEKITMTPGELDTYLETLPLSVTKAEFAVQSDEYKSLYPDMLRVLLKNNTAADISSAKVAFAAWDENNLPVKIIGQIDFSSGSYIKQVNLDEMNLVPGETYGDGMGFSLKEDSGIDMVKAAVVSFETFNGETWENPYFDAWENLYEGVKYSEDLSIEVKIQDVSFETAEQNNSTVENASEDSAISVEELDALLNEQEVRVIETNFVVQSEDYKSIYPDMLQAIVENNGSSDIKDAIISFVAWDANNLPVKIVGQIDMTGGTYIKDVKFSDINLVPGETYGNESGYSLAQDNTVSLCKAIVKSYTTFDGETWENQYYETFSELYAGLKLDK